MDSKRVVGFYILPSGQMPHGRLILMTSRPTRLQRLAARLLFGWAWHDRAEQSAPREAIRARAITSPGRMTWPPLPSREDE